MVRTEMLELECNHEEADTRLLFHAKHAASTNDAVVIKSPDTDVFVLCLAMQRAIEKDIFFMTGTGNYFRLISIKTIVEAMDKKTLSVCLVSMLFQVEWVYKELIFFISRLSYLYDLAYVGVVS